MSDRIYIRSLTAMLAVVAMMWMLSCSDNDGVATLSGPLPVRLHVSADMLGDLNSSRAAGGDDNAESGEFMNTLCVFVVDANGTIEAKFGPDILDIYEEAQTGDLTDWTSDEFTLTAGEKTVYAFANWQTADSEDNKWAALIAKEVGATIGETDLNFLVVDPASKVNLTATDPADRKYIPMSGKATATIGGTDLNYSNQLISVGLDRLVGKVTIAVQGETSTMVEGSETAQAVTIESLSFTGWADNVPLMSDGNSTYTYTYEEGYSVAYEESERPVIAVGSTMQIASFYVNETTRPTENGGFGITMQTDRYGGVTYTAATTTTAIPRNYILPLTLTLDQYELELTPTAMTSILGYEAELAYESPIYFEDNTYYITMLDVTSTFSITPSLKYKGTTVSGVSWDWTYLNEDKDESTYSIDDETTGEGTYAITVTTLTATPGYEYAFTLGAAWTESSSSSVAHSRLYNVKVVFEEGFPSFVRASRAWWSRSYGSELLRLRVRE